MDPFLGEIRVFCGNYAPQDWAFCNGQLMAVSQNTALFSILGTQYGGDGRTTFALPNLQGSAAMHQGRGNGLTPRSVGEQVGQLTVSLVNNEMPAHNHIPQSQTAGSSDSPTGDVWADVTGRVPNIYGSTADVTMSTQAVQPSGNSQPHNNMQPFLGMNFIIALNGVYPTRS